MKKRAYHSGETSEVTLPMASPDKFSATESVGRSFSASEMSSEYLEDNPDHQSQENLPQSHPEDQEAYPKVIDLLVNLGDEMDSAGEEALAGFSDFLIKKFAEANEIDYTKMYNQLMLRINNADISNTNETLKKLTKIYSRTLVLEFLKNKNLTKSRQSAYKKTLHRADQYLSES